MELTRTQLLSLHSRGRTVEYRAAADVFVYATYQTEGFVAFI